MVGEVTTWYMTEEERLAYIQKYPIKPTKNCKGTSFENVYTMQMDKTKERNKQPTMMDKVDKEELHRMFMAGDKLKDIAKAFDITIPTLDKYLTKQREINPDKWPRRAKTKGENNGR